jgi:cyanate lyase
MDGSSRDTQDLTKDQIRERLMDARSVTGLTWDEVALEAGIARTSLVTSITSGRTSMRRLDDMRTAMAQLCRDKAMELMQMATLLDELPTNWRVD